MTTINVNLSSLDEGTVPTVTDSVTVAEGEQLTLSVDWPAGEANTNTITVDFDFSKSGDQDPFNDEIGGDTQVSLTRTPPSTSASTTLKINSEATFATDTYDLILTINGVQYSTDPMIIVDEG